MIQRGIGALRSSVLILLGVASCRSTQAFQPTRRRAFAPNRQGVLQVASTDLHHQLNNTLIEISCKDSAEVTARNFYVVQPSSTSIAPTLNSWERWCMERLETWYAMSQRVKCPFFRRRYGDTLDHVEWMVRHLVIRPTCLDTLGPTLACCPVDSGNKMEQLPVHTIVNMLQRDWEGKGYYVTGKLSPHIYRDDCLFTSPDPDLPIRGLRKYMGVASHLFDNKMSSSELLFMEVSENCHDAHNVYIKATWKMHLTLRLPWKPQLPALTGTTTYFLDDSHLIHLHHETWDMEVAEAFTAMFIRQDQQSHKSSVSEEQRTSCPFARFFFREKA